MYLIVINNHDLFLCKIIEMKHYRAALNLWSTRHKSAHLQKSKSTLLSLIHMICGINNVHNINMWGELQAETPNNKSKNKMYVSPLSSYDLMMTLVMKMLTI